VSLFHRVCSWLVTIWWRSSVSPLGMAEQAGDWTPPSKRPRISWSPGPDERGQTQPRQPVRDRTAPREGTLRAWVTDDGTGGATLEKGRGLRGLEDRLHAVGGRLLVTSPSSGPTTSTAERSPHDGRRR
jgi:hypothetical protein